MQYKDFTKLMDENIRLMWRLKNRLQSLMVFPEEYSKQQVLMLVRLYISGKAKLKDIANRECMSTANLCSLFRKMEQLNLVVRDVDADDRRDTWYSVTKYGQSIAKTAVDRIFNCLENIFLPVLQDEEAKLTDAMTMINTLLKKMEYLNA